MVAIADKVASTLEEKKGSITEDEVRDFIMVSLCFYETTGNPFLFVWSINVSVSNYFVPDCHV